MPTLQGNLEKRRHAVEQQAEMTVKYSIVEGTIPVEGMGETLTVINFPIQYLERPVFTFGHELADNVWPVAGSFPTASASVASWIMVERSPTKRYWVGASLAMVITGVNTAKSLIHFTFAGRALRNPVTTASTTTDIL